MTEENNIEKPDGQEPVNEKASGQQSVSERNKSERKFFTGENVGVYSLLVGLIVVLLTLLFYTISEIDATRVEITAVKDGMLERLDKDRDETLARMDKDRAETLAGIQSLGESLRDGIRAGFAGIDNRVVSNDERIDNVYSREIELNQKRNEDDEKRDQEIDSLGNRVSSLEAAQESEG